MVVMHLQDFDQRPPTGYVSDTFLRISFSVREWRAGLVNKKLLVHYK